MPPRIRLLFCYASAGLLCLAAACSPPPAVAALPSAAPVQLTPSVSPSPLASDTPLPATSTATAVPSVPVCSPLEGVALEELPERISNPYNPPPPGSDDPHMGVDLADMRGEERIAYAGLPVHLVLSGRVAGVILDRFPYGNAVLVETSLEDLPAGWAAALQLPTPAPTLETHSSLTCPSGYSPASWDASRRALYLLYAHLQAAPLVQPGESVACGQVIGAIGDSGNALAPHLHLEARLGPAGAQFASLAHYDDTASLEEMENYCTWRISRLFQLIDPFTLLHAPAP